ncbi:MAG: alpha/beta hydrolase [Microcoleaceae cyanobacterium]
MIKSILLIYCSIGLYLFFFADKMIFLPSPSSYAESEDILKIPTVNNNKIAALYLPNAEANYTILYAHGNAEDIGQIKFHLQQLYQNGFSVLAYDYPGYGISTGKPTEKNVYLAIDAAYNYLIQTLNIPADKIIVYGRSVGGGSALELAVNNPVAGVILESTFTTPFRVVIPFPIFPFEKFDNVKKIQNINSPVLIMHGKQDNIIPIEHSQKLYELASVPKLSLWVEEAGHNDFFYVADEQYWEQLKAFIDLIENNKTN